MTSIISVPPELVEQWVDLLESHSDQAVFTLAAHWGYTQAVEELEEFLKKTVDTHCSNSMTDHPITPPPELVQQWINEEDGLTAEHIAIRAAQWGADQELLACGNYLKQCAAWEEEDVTEFYNYRRPRPLSLKELALESVKRFEKSGEFFSDQMRELEFIRKALEQLDD